MLIFGICSPYYYFYTNNQSDSDYSSTFKLEYCECTRSIMKTGIEENILLNSTTCGLDAFRRGSQQKVVSFAFYGDKNSTVHKAKGYFEGILWNLEDLSVLYDGAWIMRLYHDFNKHHPVMGELCEFACNNDRLDLCFVPRIPHYLLREGVIYYHKSKFLNQNRSVILKMYFQRKRLDRTSFCYKPKFFIINDPFPKKLIFHLSNDLEVLPHS